MDLPRSHVILMFILPFSNEIANALTISKVGEFKRLYKPCSKSLDSTVRSSLIDLLALFSIIWNVSYMSSKHGTLAGCLFGIVILILSFIIPNLFMEDFINFTCKKEIIGEGNIETCGKYKKLLFCSLFILSLLLVEIMISKQLKQVKWKYSR